MSIGGFLGPILAGLTGYAEQQRQAEQSRVRQQEAQMRQAMFGNYLKQQTDQNAAESGFFNALSGGGNLSGLGQIAKPQPVGGTPTIDMPPDAGGGFSMGADSPTRTPGKGFGGRAGGNGGYTVPALYDLAVKAGYEPGEKAATAAAISMAESSGNPGAHNTQGEDSYGLMQLNADAHGDLARTMDPLQNMRNSLKVSKGGADWSPWSAYKGGGYKQFLPEAMAAAKRGGSGGGAPQVNGAGVPVSQAQLGDEDGGGDPGAGEGATVPMAQVEIPPDMQKEARQVEVKVAQAVDPMARGKMSLEGLAKSIEKSMPGASPHAKFLALEKLQKFMAPIEQERRQQDMEMLREKFRADMQRDQFNQQNARDDKRAGQQNDRDDQRQRDRLEREGWSIETDADGTRYRYNKITGKAAPLTGTGEYTPQTAQPKQGAGPKSRNIEVMDGEGKVIFRGAARQGAQGWVADKDNKPVEIPEDGNIRISSTSGGPGKQAAAQLNRVIAAGNELSGAMRDLLELPSGSVAGVFQGLQAMPADSLGEAMKRSLANKLTDEAASDVKIGFQGVARFVASLEAFGAATGLVGLTKSAEVYMPQTGDTMGNVLRKYATLRRDAERALEAGAASPDVGQEQKKLIDKVRKELTEAVPFTVSDVNKLQHGDAETYRDVAKKLLGGAAGGDREKGTAPVPGHTEDGYRFKGGDPADPKNWDRVQ